MKLFAQILGLISCISAFATSDAGIICRNDQRMIGGPLSELILSPNQDGTYLLQSQYMPSLNSPTVDIVTWNDGLLCKVDARSNLAFCQNEQEQISVQIQERKIAFYDSIKEDAKKKNQKYLDIALDEAGVKKHKTSFSASHCHSFGGEA